MDDRTIWKKTNRVF